ncbi:spermatogenesis-associated protein 7 isoform X2 [Choloepus didactylus]|uniref:spermatogenesis-associated protein 7 isoform X2 n=1 Tax=Choloepus didactylus TaxID=27675 RepID=UPI0018A0D850|nr:spermatogenesis-associated protein 7 isoform X2 [Choloepus didactylus]
MDGSRRVRATSILPRYGPPCQFKGHLSTKSNAAVDCSVPLSMSTSIKYADQQRREKLKKELAKCEKELKLAKTAMLANSKNNSSSLLNTLQEPSGEPQDKDDVLIREVNEFPSFARSPVLSAERLLRLGLPKSSKVLRNGTEKNSASSLSSVDYTGSGPRKPCSGTMYGKGTRSAFPNSNRFQLVISKAPSGDLLDKHSELFSNKQLPFTPRTLKTEATSFLSQYRYYTPAKRRKDFTDQRIEAETQTELSSFKSDFETAETKSLTDSEVNIKQAPRCITCDTKDKITPLPLQGPGLMWDRIKDDTLQPSLPRTVPQYSLQPSLRRKIYSDEEELLYLNFIEDITDDILKLGLFSNRFLERLFERHIRQNKHHLEEEKMRHLLQVLKVDLGCTPKENSASVNLDAVNTLNLFDFEKAENSEQNEYQIESEVSVQQERQEYQKALDMLLSAQRDENEMCSSSNEFFLPVCKTKHSEEVIIERVNDETNFEPSTWFEKNPSASDSLTDPETSVNVIEVDSDIEKVETSDELACFSSALSHSNQFSRVKGVNNHGMEGPTLKIMDMTIEDCPLEV